MKETLRPEVATHVHEFICEQAALIPAEDRLLLIKTLEGEQDFEYVLQSGSWLRVDDVSIDSDDEETELCIGVQMCEVKTKAMCIIGALAAVKLPQTATTKEVVQLANKYADKNQIAPWKLDDIIDAQAIPEFIEELRRLEVG